MTEHGYSRCHFDHCVYFKKLENGSFIILLFFTHNFGHHDDVVMMVYFRLFIKTFS
jgi:hypothetical protein